MESRESCLAADGRAWKVDGRAQALVGPGLATPLAENVKVQGSIRLDQNKHIGTPIQ